MEWVRTLVHEHKKLHAQLRPILDALLTPIEAGKLLPDAKSPSTALKNVPAVGTALSELCRSLYAEDVRTRCLVFVALTEAMRRGSGSLAAPSSQFGVKIRAILDVGTDADIDAALAKPQTITGALSGAVIAEEKVTPAPEPVKGLSLAAAPSSKDLRAPMKESGRRRRKVETAVAGAAALAGPLSDDEVRKREALAEWFDESRDSIAEHLAQVHAVFAPIPKALLLGSFGTFLRQQCELHPARQARASLDVTHQVMRAYMSLIDTDSDATYLWLGSPTEDYHMYKCEPQLDNEAAVLAEGRLRLVEIRSLDEAKAILQSKQLVPTASTDVADDQEAATVVFDGDESDEFLADYLVSATDGSVLVFAVRDRTTVFDSVRPFLRI
jgi:hypothetical protein